MAELDQRTLPPEAVTRWCAGLPCMGELPLTAEQRALAARVYRAGRLRLFLYCALAIGLLPASIVISVQLRAAYGRDSWVPIAFSMMLFFFALPLTIAKVVAQIRVIWPLRSDLARGVMQRFIGTIAEAAYEDEDPDVVALVTASVLERGQGEQALGILPTSARLLHINGRDVLPERRLHVAATATPQPNVLRYSLPPDVKQAFGMQNGLKRRRFGDSERHELDQHIGRLTAVPWMLVVLTAFVAITVSGFIVRGMSSSEELMGLGWIVAWTIVAIRHIRSYLLARRFEDDLEVGWILSWETPEPTDARGPAQSTSGVQRMPFSSAEVLPISQMDWMIDGKPAAWRRVIQRTSS